MLILNGSSFAVLRFGCVNSAGLWEEKGGLFFFLSDICFRISPLLIKALVELTVPCFSVRKFLYPPHFLLICRGIVWFLQGLAVCSAG